MKRHAAAHRTPATPACTRARTSSGRVLPLDGRRLVMMLAVTAGITMLSPPPSLAQGGAGTGGVRAGSTAAAQDTGYVPAQDFPNGRQIEAVYFGANWCRPCRAPSMKGAIRAMKPLLAVQAKNAGATFSAMVVALDRDFSTGAQFIAPLGAFDEYSIGADLVSTAAQQYIWSDSLGMPVVPQVIVFERTVAVTRGRPMSFGPRHILLRVRGDSVPLWVAAGAPLRLAKGVR